MFGLSKFCTGLHTLKIEQTLMNNLSPTRLNRKIVLSKSNLSLPRVTILSNQITRIAGKHHIINLAIRVGTNLDHFAHLRKMVGNILSGIATRLF